MRKFGVDYVQDAWLHTVVFVKAAKICGNLVALDAKRSVVCRDSVYQPVMYVVSMTTYTRNYDGLCKLRHVVFTIAGMAKCTC